MTELKADRRKKFQDSQGATRWTLKTPRGTVEIRFYEDTYHVTAGTEFIDGCLDTLAQAERTARRWGGVA